MVPCWKQLTPLHRVCHMSHTRPPRWEVTQWTQPGHLAGGPLPHPYLITAQSPVMTLCLSFLPLPAQNGPPSPVFKSRLNVWEKGQGSPEKQNQREPTESPIYIHIYIYREREKFISRNWLICDCGVLVNPLRLGEASGLEARAAGAQGCLLDNSLLVQGAQSLLYPGLQLTGWGPPHLGGGNLLYSGSDHFNITLTHKQFHRNIKNSVWARFWAHLFHLSQKVWHME